MKYSTSSLLALLPIVSAHFQLKSPAPRGLDEDNMPNFPCGGFNTPSAQRTPFPLTNGSIIAEFGHSATNIEVLIAFGNSPGSAFNTILRRPFLADGLGDLCVGDLSIPANLNITVGTNATIQVQSNGDPTGGLYSCADITFVASAPSAGAATFQQCGTSAFTISPPEVSGHPNGTSFAAAAGGSAASSPSSSGTASSTATSSTPSATRTSGAVGMKVMGLGSVVAAAVGVLALVL